MRPINSIIYRYLTNADFYNMYKPLGSEAGGGGQTYIDFPIQDISIEHWERFLGDVRGVEREERTQGPAWTVPTSSIGLARYRQLVLVYQRRPQSVSVANQTLNRSSTNRVEAWHPRHGFPEPADPNDRRQCPPGLAIFFVRNADGTIWAGWFLNADTMPSPAHADVEGALRRLLTLPASNRHRAGVIEFAAPTVWLDEHNIIQPFQPPQVGIPASTEPVLVDQPSRPSLSREHRSQLRQRRQRTRARATDEQGYQLDPRRRRAVEKYAMDCAKEAYPGAEDTSLTQPFDLRAYADGREVRVEVKGTLGSGQHVLLTANEIENAHGSEWQTDLLIVSEIQLTLYHGEFIASGGRIRIIRDWLPSMEDLTPTQYRYRVPE